MHGDLVVPPAESAPQLDERLVLPGERDGTKRMVADWIVLLLLLLLAGCERAAMKPEAQKDMKTWFADRGIAIDSDPPPEQAAKPAEDYEPLLGDVTGNGTVTLWDLRVLWNYLISSDAPRWYDMDLLDIDRDGDADWNDLKLMGEYLSDPERGNLYGIGLPPERPFDIELVFVDGHGFSEEHQALFEQAAAVWENLITADIEDWPSSWGVVLDTDDYEWWPGSDYEKWFGRVLIDGDVDDLEVHVTTASADDGMIYGAYTVPMSFRGDNLMPLSALIVVSADLVTAEPEDLVFTVMLHELGHALGIGSSGPWYDLLRFPSRGSPGRDAHFRGTAARAAFLAAGGSYPRPGVPVENEEEGGRDIHWRGSHVPNELMGSGVSYREGLPPLSAITVQALADLGYEVSPDRAEPYQIPSASAKVVAGEPRWRCGVGRMRGGRAHNPPPRAWGEF